ncbi:MAG: hypothetical protein CSB06_03870 [Bacteroidia bacterium]|nr:MAG: hypothetical protein CSB06_03870 [Bacteroidia bacterium]
MIFIYAKAHSPRLEYTCKLLFNNVLGVKFSIVTSIDTRSKIPLINYSEEELPGSLRIIPHALLFESDIKEQAIRVEFQDKIPCFFKTSDSPDLPYDLFASSFYTAVRYEEYLPFVPDAHGRFSAKESLAFRENFLQIPIVHIWSNILKNRILEKFPHLIFPEKKFEQINTIDIDVAYAFKGKPWLRQAGNIFKSLLGGKTQELKKRLDYWVKGIDYLDTYDYIKEVAESSGIYPVFFLEIGKYARYDRNLPLNRTYKSLIKKLEEFGELGIHPSYRSNFKPEDLPRLVRKLEKITKKKITKSRQHFLMLRFPETYERLISNGIEEDYTMGFADSVGFRSGLCVPYPFFNLRKNEERPLTIIPFQVMDGTLKEYMQLSVSDAQKRLQDLREETKKAGGIFVCLFHNSSLTDDAPWKGWRKVYETAYKQS